MSAIQSELGIETPENQLMDKFFDVKRNSLCAKHKFTVIQLVLQS